MEVHLPSLPLMEIFSYLDAYSLLQAAQVNKNWNELASSDVLWRRGWRQIQDLLFAFKPYGYACYISGRGITRKRQDKSVVCMVSSKNTISTWDIHKSIITWVSPVQPASIKLLTTLPEMHIAVTVDIQSTIKLWDCHNREALATSNLESPCKSLKAVITKDDPIVLAGDTLGNLYIFRIPDLHLISAVNVLPCDIDEIYCSPQKKWVLLSKKQSYILPKVFYMSSLLRRSEFSAPVSTLLEFSLCQEAFWTPRREDRITLMSRSDISKITKFKTYDLKLEEFGNKIIVKGNSIAGFLLPYYKETPNWFGVSDKDTIVCSTEFSLLLFTNNGHRLQTFQYFPEMIMRLCVDPVHVIITCNDGSMDVYAWEERSLLLRKCYRLQNRRHLPPYSFINKTLCDDVSIIQLMIDGHGPWFLMAYALNICS
ncbi:F-box/WD repeat-containing protein 15-like [Mus caroli]|uniref:F-box/WD repeat-containing protein 15-like n=1 Tax=Mus caroli TaxID=10089 RepID=A0A6P5QF56_MUSCR|nr:F-box/WD repeat-containing protein 15-like [Mus caroli]